MHEFPSLLGTKLLQSMPCNPRVLGGGAGHGTFPAGPERVQKGLLGPRSEKRFAPVDNGVAPVQKGFWMVQETLGRLLLSGLVTRRVSHKARNPRNKKKVAQK